MQHVFALLCMAAAQSVAAATWDKHTSYNCGNGYGASDLDDPVKGFGNSNITVEECEAACTRLAGCTGVKFLTANGGSACFRQSGIVLSQCKTGDAHWTMFLRPVAWEEHSMYNCGNGYGASDLDDPVTGFGDSSITVEECEAACTKLAGCTGVKFLTANGGNACYRQSNIVLSQCKKGDAHWTMFLRPVVWEEHSMYNCGNDYGAKDLDDPVNGFGNSSITVEECEAACTGLAGCTGVKFLTANGGSACYRQSDIVLSQCKTGDAHWTMFLKHTSLGFGQQLMIQI